MNSKFRRVLSAALACVMVLTLLPATALAVGEEEPSVVYGAYQNGAWTRESGDGTYTDTETGLKVSKTAVPTGNLNEYKITLTVETSTTTKVTNPNAAATVLVIDVSGSMDYCAECGKKEQHDSNCSKYVESFLGIQNGVKTDQTRIYAAKQAAKNFLDSYCGETAGAQRYVAIVSFAENANTVLGWTDVSTEIGYNSAVRAIDKLSANGGTNLDAGLESAASLLSNGTVSSISQNNKNVIALTDGKPTYYTNGGRRQGDGENCTQTILDYTEDSAETVKKSASLYTVCFGVADQNCWDESYDRFTGTTTPAGPTVGKFLEDYVATPKGVDEEGNPIIYAYTANDADGLYGAFEAITKSITEGLTGEGVTVTDPMAEGVTATLPDDVTKTETGFTWDLNEADRDERTEGEVTYYTYTLTYTVTLDPTAIEGFDEDAYYPLNGKTTLTIPGETDTVIEFPVPGVKGVLPTYTVTYAPGDYGTLEGAGEDGKVVHNDVAYGTTTPTEPVVTPEDGYYFTGWSPDRTEKVTENATYTAQYATQTAVTITGNGDTVVYNGTEQTITGFTTKGLEGYTLSGLSYSASGTDVGPHTGTFSGDIKITNSKGEDVTKQFRITEITGTLTIKPKEITITADDASKPYDGTPLTANGYEITSGTLANGQEINSVTITGSQTEFGSSPNVPSNAVIKDAKGTNVTSNYSIAYVNGTLTVNPDTSASITAKGYTGTYDGADHDAVTSITLTNGSGGVITTDGWTITYVYGNEETSTVPQFKDAGTYEVTVKAENSNYADVQTTVTVTISKKPVTLTSPDQTKMYDGTPLVGDINQFTQDGFASGERVTFTNPASITDVGETTNVINVEWGTVNPNNYDVTKQEGTLTVTKNNNSDKSVSLKATAYADVYDGQSHALITDKDVTGAVAGNEWTYTYSTDGVNYGPTVPTETNASSYDVWVKASTGNYEDLVVKVPAAISPKQVTLTSQGQSWSYNGETHSNEDVTPEGFVGSDGATYSNFASITNVGTLDNTFDYTLKAGTNAENYTITQVYGKLEITPSTNASLTVKDYTGAYDGQEHKVTYSITDYVDGNEWTITYSTDGENYGTEAPTRTDAGTTTVYVKAECDNYETLITSADIVITQRSVTLTSAPATKPYDGTPLTNPTVDAVGFVEGEGVESYDVTGSQTDVGTSKNDFSYTLKDNTKASNYQIKQVMGDLVVTPYAGDVSLVIVPYNKMYDGSSHDAVTSYSVSGVDIQNVKWTYSFSTDDGETWEEMPQYTDVGEYPVIVKATAANFDDVTSSTVVAKITPRTVILTSGDAEKTYDGNPLTNYTVTPTGDGFAPGEGASYNVTGSQTAAGESENTFDYTLWDGTVEGQKETKASNYDIQTVYGTLTVTKNGNVNTDDGVRLTVTGYTGLYDGQAHEGVIAKTVTGAVEGNEWTYTYSTDGENYTSAVPEYTDAGTYTVYVKASADNYEDLKDVATVTITKRNVVLTSASDSKVYDGTALTNDKVTVTGDGFVSGEGVESYDVTGSRTLVGSSDNRFTFRLNDNTKASNYTITAVPGVLTVYQNLPDLTLTKRLTAINGERYRSGSASVGDVLTYVITVRNNSSRTLYGVDVRDNLPDGLFLLESDLETVTLRAGESRTFTVEVLILTAGKVRNTATATVNGDKYYSNTSTIEVDSVYNPRPAPTLNTEDHVAYIIGFVDGTVRPEATITRGEVATIFFRLLTDESRAYYWSQTNRFSDVNDGDWYNNAISTLDAAGIIVDSETGLFRPGDAITRAEIAAMAAQFTGLIADKPSSFIDVPAGYWAAEAIALVEQQGWMEGYLDTFRPDDTLTRAEAMAIINRMLERAVQDDGMLKGMVTWSDNLPGTWYYADIQEATNSHSYIRTAVRVSGRSFCYETWVEILPNPDWAALEKSWSTANSK